MGWFGTTNVEVKERTIQDCIKMIENFFRKIGLNPNEQRIPDRGTYGWFVSRGSAVIFILLNKNDGMTTVRIVSPILYLPQERILPFYRRCLEINMGLLNCAFGVTKDKIALVSERPILGLDPEELEGTIAYLSSVADELDDKLGREFKAKLYRDGVNGI
jgi:hypothetical protein